LLSLEGFTADLLSDGLLAGLLFEEDTFERVSVLLLASDLTVLGAVTASFRLVSDDFFRDMTSLVFTRFSVVFTVTFASICLGDGIPKYLLSVLTFFTGFLRSVSGFVETRFFVSLFVRRSRFGFR
jgi:CBS domain containing-hemolysin-like protein